MTIEVPVKVKRSKVKVTARHDVSASKNTHAQESLFYVAPPIVVHFNYVKFAAEYSL